MPNVLSPTLTDEAGRGSRLTRLEPLENLGRGVEAAGRSSLACRNCIVAKKNNVERKNNGERAKNAYVTLKTTTTTTTTMQAY